MLTDASVWSPVIPPLKRLTSTATQISRGKTNNFRYTTAGYTLWAIDGYGLCNRSLARPACFASNPVSVRQLIPLIHTSSRPNLTVTPLCFSNLHLHQVGNGTHTHLVICHARHTNKGRFAPYFKVG